MDIHEILRNRNSRLTNDDKDRWLVWGKYTNQWCVWQNSRYDRISTCLYRGDSLDEAVKILLSD